jgi:hypothetical protein
MYPRLNAEATAWLDSNANYARERLEAVATRIESDRTAAD